MKHTQKRNSAYTIKIYRLMFEHKYNKYKKKERKRDCEI